MTIRLAIFDVDGVLKQAPDPYMLLHRHFGTEIAGARHLDAFLKNDISYDEFAELDAGAWQGRTITETKTILQRNPYVDGAHEMAQGLQHRTIPLVLISSGFDLHVEDVAAELDADEYLCNGLDHDGQTLTGTMTVFVPWGGKGPIVRQLLERRNIHPSECIAVGDSTADIPSFEAVGHAVAVRPRQAAVSDAAAYTLPDLNGMLSIIDSIS